MGASATNLNHMGMPNGSRFASGIEQIANYGDEPKMKGEIEPSCVCACTTRTDGYTRPTYMNGRQQQPPPPPAFQTMASTATLFSPRREMAHDWTANEMSSAYRCAAVRALAHTPMHAHRRRLPLSSRAALSAAAAGMPMHSLDYPVMAVSPTGQMHYGEFWSPPPDPYVSPPRIIYAQPGDVPLSDSEEEQYDDWNRL
jgi:hypothetical protein